MHHPQLVPTQQNVMQSSPYMPNSSIAQNDSDQHISQHTSSPAPQGGMGPRHNQSLQGQNLLAHLQQSMSASMPVRDGGLQGIPGGPDSFVNNDGDRQRHMMRMAAEAQMQMPASMAGRLPGQQNPTTTQPRPPTSSMSQYPEQHPLSPVAQKQLSFWQLANQLPTSNSPNNMQSPMPHNQSQPQPPYGALPHPQHQPSYGRPGPPPPGIMMHNGMHMPFSHVPLPQPMGLPGQQGPMGMMQQPPPHQYMGPRQTQMMNGSPQMTPDLMALLGAMQARPRA